VQSFRENEGSVGEKQGVLYFLLILPYFEPDIDFFCILGSWVVEGGREKKIGMMEKGRS
jgi:hypothetical protein